MKDLQRLEKILELTLQLIVMRRILDSGANFDFQTRETMVKIKSAIAALKGTVAKL